MTDQLKIPGHLDDVGALQFASRNGFSGTVQAWIEWTKVDGSKVTVGGVRWAGQEAHDKKETMRAAICRGWTPPRWWKPWRWGDYHYKDFL